MPRDGSGNYTLPSPENPVSNGTVIDDTWANPTANDIATALTATLDRFGRGSMNVPLLNFSGTEAAPGISFTLEPGSGFYRAAPGEFRLSINGKDVLRFIDDSAAPAGSQRPVDVYDGNAWLSLLFGDGTESPAFEAVTADDLSTTGDLSVSGGFSMSTEGVFPGPIGLCNVRPSPFSFENFINVSSVSNPGGGTNVVTFSRNLRDDESCFVFEGSNSATATKSASNAITVLNAGSDFTLLAFLEAP